MASYSNSDRLLHLADVVAAVEVDEYKIALAEVVHAELEQVVLGQAAFDAHTLLLLQVAVVHGIDLERALAEGDGVAQA